MEDTNCRYIAKVDCWFKEGTEARLVTYYYTNAKGEKWGLFNGTYIVGSCNDDENEDEDGGYDKFWYDQGHKDGDEVEMNEVCCYTEFEIINDDDLKKMWDDIEGFKMDTIE